MGKWIVRGVLVLLVAAGVWAGWRALKPKDRREIVTVAVSRGPLTITVTATGRLAPTTEVQVGCEISGTVEEILAEHNDRVRLGQVIARLKPELFRAEHAQAQAELAAANARLQEAEVLEAEAKRQYERIKKLNEEGAAPKDELDVRQASWEAAEAATQASRAAIQGAQGRVELAKYRLDRTVITSPIDGIVLDRRVDVGQTVAATLMTPELFVLAEDLSRMELLADVSEADVGYICAGQSAGFTVNAYRDRTFQGRVREVRNQPRTAGNVVTYTVVIDVTNEGQLLRPGMPADVDIEIVRREQVTKVPNTALRFRPPVPPDEVRRLLADISWPPPPEPILVAARRPTDTQPAQLDFVPPPLEPAKATLWKHDKQNDTWKPVPVWTAFTDNRETAISAGTDDPDPLVGDSFVVEVRESRGGMSEFEQAILLSQPENRHL